MYCSVVHGRRLILDSKNPHLIVVCFVFWLASEPLIAFGLMMLYSCHYKFSMFILWLHQSTVIHL